MGEVVLPRFSGELDDDFAAYEARVRAYLSINDIPCHSRDAMDVLLLSLVPGSQAALWLESQARRGTFDDCISLLRSQFGTLLRRRLAQLSAQNMLSQRTFREKRRRGESVQQLVSDVELLCLRAGLTSDDARRKAFVRCFLEFPRAHALLRRANTFEDAISEAFRWESGEIAKEAEQTSRRLNIDLGTPRSQRVSGQGGRGHQVDDELFETAARARHAAMPPTPSKVIPAAGKPPTPQRNPTFSDPIIPRNWLSRRPTIVANSPTPRLDEDATLTRVAEVTPQRPSSKQQESEHESEVLEIQETPLQTFSTRSNDDADHSNVEELDRPFTAHSLYEMVGRDDDDDDDGRAQRSMHHPRSFSVDFPSRPAYNPEVTGHSFATVRGQPRVLTGWSEDSAAAPRKSTNTFKRFSRLIKRHKKRPDA